MTLQPEDIDFIKTHMSEWLAEQSFGKPPAVYEIELRERSVRAEEQLNLQRELMREGFEAMERRFEQIDKRFEQVDKRFEQIDKRLEEQRADMLARFEQVDKRFEQMNQRFAAMETRMDRFMRWSFGLTLTVGGIVIASIKYLP